MSELKPCPFCGKEILMDGTVYNINTHGEPRVYCANCGATGPNDVSYGRADEMWNLRRPEDALRDHIAKLETEPTELRTRLAVCEDALISMVQQFFYSADGSNVYSHAFMSAEEEAAAYLVGVGIAGWNDEHHSQIVFPEVKE